MKQTHIFIKAFMLTLVLQACVTPKTKYNLVVNRNTGLERQVSMLQKENETIRKRNELLERTGINYNKKIEQTSSDSSKWISQKNTTLQQMQQLQSKYLAIKIDNDSLRHSFSLANAELESVKGAVKSREAYINELESKLKYIRHENYEMSMRLRR